MIRIAYMIMKHFLHIIVLLSFFVASACNPMEQREDSISLSSKGAVTDYQQQTMSITVTSSGEWTLTGSYDWAVQSVKAGKNGDSVLISVTENTSGNDRKAVYTFRCGEAVATYSLTQQKGPDKPVQPEEPEKPEEPDRPLDPERLSGTVGGKKNSQ